MWCKPGTWYGSLLFSDDGHDSNDNDSCNDDDNR